MTTEMIPAQVEAAATAEKLYSLIRECTYMGHLAATEYAEMLSAVASRLDPAEVEWREWEDGDELVWSCKVRDFVDGGAVSGPYWVPGPFDDDYKLFCTLRTASDAGV